MNVIVRAAIRTIPSEWSKNLEHNENRGKGFSGCFYLLRLTKEEYVVKEEVNGVLVYRQGKHFHEGNVLGNDILVLEIQGGCDDCIDVIVGENEV